MRGLTDREHGPVAFVLGLGANGYGVARSLVRSGIGVIGFHHADWHHGRYSRLFRSHFLSPAEPPSEITCRLVHYAKVYGGKPVLFAAGDEFAHVLAHEKETLQSHFHFHWLEDSVAEQVFDKRRMTLLCEELGIAIPRTVAPLRLEDLDHVELPAIVKPIRSFGLDFPAGAKNYVASTSDQLREFFRQYPHLIARTVVQELIGGPDSAIVQCNVLVGNDGQTRTCGIRKLRQYPPGSGNMCFGRSESDPVAASLAIKLLQSLPYKGMASLEFKTDNGTGEYRFIEMNPRLPWYCSIFPVAGVNLAHLTYLDLTGQKIPPSSTQREGVHWVYASNDRKARREAKSADANRASWLAMMSKARSFAWWDFRDPAPFVAASLTPTRREAIQLSDNPTLRLKW